MSSSALLKLHIFHRELNAQALEATRHFTALNTPEIAEYSRSFQQCLPPSFEHTDARILLQTLQTAKLVLYGDFHTLKQSQQGFLLLLCQAREEYPERPMMVALEIFNAADQDHIDDFQSGRITEEHFLKMIDYFNKWGFPWEYYQPIVDYCIRHSIHMRGINSQFTSPNRLVRRDEFAATILNSWLLENPLYLCFCLIGEHHLADSHLLDQLDKKIRTIRVVANVDDYALSTFNLPMASNEYLRLASDFYCVLNTAPWLKWQSLSMWEEFHGNMDQGAHPEEFDLYTEHHYDFDYQLLHMIKAINEFLGLSISSSDLTQFDLYIRPDRSTVSYLKSKLNLSRYELLAIEEALSTNGFYYCSPSKAILMQDASFGHFAEAAGHFLYDILRVAPAIAFESSIQERVERQICSTVASLLMNPRQPTLKASELEQFYLAMKRKRLVGKSKIQREAYRTVLPLFEDLTGPQANFRPLRASSLEDKDRRLGYLISRQLGEVMGSFIFHQLLHSDGDRLIVSLQAVFRGSLVEQTGLLRELQMALNRPRTAS